MTHSDKGHYSNKHQKQDPDPAYAGEINAASSNGEISCAAAHKAAGALNLSPEKTGEQIDLLEFRITQCRLGLFGHSGSGKQFNPDISIGKDLETRLTAATVQGRISCKACWEIAAALNLKKLDVGSACEKMGLRIKPCQLGTF
jgi:hypothetical protein